MAVRNMARLVEELDKCQFYNGGTCCIDNKTCAHLLKEKAGECTYHIPSKRP